MKGTGLIRNKGYKRLCIKTVINMGGEGLSLYLLHLSLRKRIRRSQFAQLNKVIKRDKNKKKVILGDFNLFGGPKELKNLVSGTDLIIQKNAMPTYPSWKPKIKLDWIIHSNNAELRNFKIHKILLSDHLAMSFEV